MTSYAYNACSILFILYFRSRSLCLFSEDYFDLVALSSLSPFYNFSFLSSFLLFRRRNYILLSDILEHLRISRGALLKKVKRLDIREMPWSQFMAEIADKPLCVAPKYSPPDSSTQEGVAELVPMNYNLRRLLNIRVESVNMT